MNCRKRSLAIAAFPIAVFLSFGIDTLKASDAGLATRFAAAHMAKQHCINACRARYRDCRHLNQLPPSGCLGIYHDCTRYSCTGLGPG